MGASQSSNQLNIVTLNYSGILLSPFQFYCEEDYYQLFQLSKCFKDLLINSTYSNIKNWQVGQINRKTQRQRYTPIYRKDVGIQDNKLISYQKFTQKWKQQFNKIKEQKKIQLKCTLQQQQQALKFDLHCFKSFIKYLQQKKFRVDKNNNLTAQQYQQFMDKFFKKSYIHQQIKVQIVIKAVIAQNIDIFFVQQASKTLQDKLAGINGLNGKKYLIFKEGMSSLIAINREKFPNKPHDHKEVLKRLQNQQFVQNLNWNLNTTMCMIDNFIFICTHLSSRAQRNPEQRQKLISDLQKLRKIYPMCQIIVGGNLNTYISPQQAPTKFNIFPDDEQMFTSSKKRTWLQPQLNKANLLVRQCKDMILSTLPLVNPKVSTITGQDSSLFSYLPNDKHPCAHFVVSAKVLRNY